MNNRLNIAILAVILSFLTVFGFSNIAKAGAVISNDGDAAAQLTSDNGVTNPSGDDSSNPGAVINPSADDSSTGGAVINPSADDSSTGSQAVVNPSADDSVTPATPVTPANNGGSSSSSGSSGSYSSGGSRVLYMPTVSGNTSCSLINSFMTIGGNNNTQDVLKLQSFLAGTEKMNVKVTGVYDEQTQNAVKSFQTKYSSEILAPYGATQPTGNVVITTKKKINELACSTKTQLSAGEMATIKAIANRTTTNTSVETNPTSAPSESTFGPSVGTNDSSTSVASDDDTSAVDSNVAVASNPNIVKRFWNFIVNLFR